MNEILESLVREPGIRMAALVMEEGVPICAATQQREGLTHLDRDDELNALVATGMSLFQDVSRSAAGLSWQAPERLFLRASLGGLLLCNCGDIRLLLILDRGVCLEQIDVCVDGANARIQRALRELSAGSPPAPFANPGPQEAQPNKTTMHLDSIPEPGGCTQTETLESTGDH